MSAFSTSLISPELLSVLRCPVTGSALMQEGQELVAVTPDADGRTLRYTIEDGIPLLLPPELLAAATAAPSDQHDGGPSGRDQHDGGPSGRDQHDGGPSDGDQHGSGRSDGGPRHAADTPAV